MWSRITTFVKHRNEDQPDTTAGASTLSQGQVLDSVRDVHPNLSMFHHDSEELRPPMIPPNSPSSKSRRNIFKRASRNPDELRAPSPAPSQLSIIGNPKKKKSSNQLHLSQSLGRSATPDPSLSSSFADGRPSMEALRSPNFSSVRSMSDARRPSLDILQHSEAAVPPTPTLLQGSTRSILRDPTTPGTGNNVRFFSRNAYGEMSTDCSQSAEVDLQSPLPPLSTDTPTRRTSTSLSALVTRSPPRNSRPSLGEIFSPMNEQSQSRSLSGQVNTEANAPIASEMPLSDPSNPFDISQDIDMPAMPPGLHLSLNLDSGLDIPISDEENLLGVRNGAVFTSTPFKDAKGKGKERAVDIIPENPVPPESIFHAREKSPKLPPILHDRSNSFSFGQTVFYSVNDDPANRSSTSSAVPSLASDLKSASSTSSPRSPNVDSPSQSSIRSRSRALSDTVFQSILRSSSTSSNKPPEADINDESSSELVVYAAPPQPPPDPFSVTAKTYYGPQTMIPVTPPRGNYQRHARKTSKEESIIVSLQTQISIQAELFQQYETDLRARDEMVEILTLRLTEAEKEETKRKGILRAWKKKVAELERACRVLEDEVDNSRQEASERSIMDEASGEALRMLHRQIAGLERERQEWTRQEELLREEVQTLEDLVRERSEDVLNLKESIWNRDESQRELQDGLREAKEQIDQMGNISIAMVDEAEFKQAIAEIEQREEEERERHREVESKWEQQRAEMAVTTENANAEKIALEGELETIKQQLKSREDEYGTLKAELEAQWGHAERASERIQALERENRELEAERHGLEEANAQGDDGRRHLNNELSHLKEHVSSLEAEREELENERQSLYDNLDHLEAQLSETKTELAEVKEEYAEFQAKIEDLTKQVEQGKKQADYKHKAAEEFATRLEEAERQLRFNVGEVSRLEENKRKAEGAHQASLQELKRKEHAIIELEGRINTMTREHARMNHERVQAREEVERTDKERARLQELASQEATYRQDNEQMKKEVEKMKKELEILRKDSADKDLKLVQMNRQHEANKEDIIGLNIALDAKQQELELIKRKYSVTGTAGSTPASKLPNSRRDSYAFGSRPSSVASEKDLPTFAREKKLSNEGPAKVDSNKDKRSGLLGDTPSKIASGALAKSARANNAISTPASVTPKPRINGTMGPPPRPSMHSSTPTPAMRSSLSRSTSASSSVFIKPRPTTPASATSSTSSVSLHRKVSSGPSALDQSHKLPSAPKGAPASGKESGNTSEKEKENLSMSASRRRTMLGTPA